MRAITGPVPRQPVARKAGLRSVAETVGSRLSSRHLVIFPEGERLRPMAARILTYEQFVVRRGDTSAFPATSCLKCYNSPAIPGTRIARRNERCILGDITGCRQWECQEMRREHGSDGNPSFHTRKQAVGTANRADLPHRPPSRKSKWLASLVSGWESRCPTATDPRESSLAACESKARLRRSLASNPP
jgi:hypothetical protein